MTARMIAFEGIDGTGKTLQIQMLAYRLGLLGIPVVLTAEPTDSEVGRLIRKTLASDTGWRDQLAYLYAADRAWHLEHTVLPALQAGKWVLTDRYVLSSLAYPGVAEAHYLNLNFRVPDLTLLLDLDVEVALERITKRGTTSDMFEKRDQLEHIRRQYLNASKAYPEVRVVRAEGTPEEVSFQVWEAVQYLSPLRRSS